MRSVGPVSRPAFTPRRKLSTGIHRATAGAALLLAAWLALPSDAPAADRKPNVVFILMDDLGYGDIGCQGAPDIRTPNIDRLAREGVRLTDAYANGPVCTPTRAAFLTGRYQQRVGLERAIASTDRVTGLPVTETSVARMLADAGYATALIGKWHLGLSPEQGPNAHGFGEFFGFLAGHLDYYSHRNITGQPDLFEGTRPVERKGYLTDLITERSVGFVERHPRDPFFLFVSYSAVHDPWQAPDRPDDIRTLPPSDGKDPPDHARRLEKWVRGSREDYARMLERADEGVGRILAALDATGLAADTLVIFTSDNGGERFSRNYPLFHQKGSLWEGGIRVPCLLRWPGRLPAGAASSQAAITMDLTASILAAAGTTPPAGRPLDGINLLPILRGDEPPRERTFCWRFPGSAGQKAVRRGKWKYVRDLAGGNEQEFLFDLEADIGERHTLGYQHPEILAELRNRLRDWEREVDRNRTEAVRVSAPGEAGRVPSVR